MSNKQPNATTKDGNTNQNITIPQALTIAAQKIDNGDLQPAEAILRTILEKQPDNPFATHLLGIIAHQVGRTELALEMIGKAIDKLPNEAQFHANRGEMCRLLKRLDEAVKHGELAIKLAPDYATAHSNLGIAYYDQKEYEKAKACQEKALELDPELVKSLNNMGSIMRGLKDKEAAIGYYRKALQINPNFLESINNLGAILLEEEKTDEAIQTLLQALKLNPKYADAHNNLGNAFMVKEDFNRAMHAFQNAMKLKPNYPEAQLGLARIYSEREQLDDALVAANRAKSLDPDKAAVYIVLGDIYLKTGQYAECRQAYLNALAIDKETIGAYLGLGQLQLEQGEMKEAQRSFERAQELAPDEVAPHVCLAQARKVTKDGETLSKLEEEAEKIESLPDRKAMALHFSLGKAYDDIGEYDKAFPHFQEGCRIKRRTIEYNPDNHDLACKNIRDFFSKETLERLGGAGDPSDLPVFVLGMPRSGTTLTETILASHPDVFGAGELNELLDIANQPKFGVSSEGYPLSMQGLTKEDLNEMGARYIKALRSYNTDAKRITDKMPANFMTLGLIHLMLPNAKIVHVMRNSADICLSAFTKNFNKSQNHSYDLVEMGRFYVNYELLMEHWRKVLPEGSFYEVQYERLVANPEEESRKLVEYCELEWDEACLTPHKTERNVKTASITQVRQPVYTSSVERWKRYEKHLQPLLEALGEYAPAK